MSPAAGAARWTLVPERPLGLISARTLPKARLLSTVMHRSSSEMPPLITTEAVSGPKQ